MLDSNQKKDNLSEPNNQKIKKSVAVWLIIKDGLNSGKIALQKRLAFDDQSNPGLCQPTWNGKLEDGESLADAIKREAKEELGEDFYNNFNFSELTQFGFDSFDYDGSKFISYNFIGSVIENEIKSVKMHQKAMLNFIYVNKEDLNNIKSKNDQLANLQKDIVLFNDQYNFLVKFLQSRQYYAFL